MKPAKRKVLITGGTRGIGRAIALRFAEEGAELVLNYLDNQDAAQTALDEIRKTKAKATLVKANLANLEEVKALADKAASILGEVNCLVHCAALGTFKPVSKLRTNQWDLTFDINVKSFLILSQKLAPKMPKGSTILALSSSGSQKVVPNYGATGISKASLEALVRYLAVEYIASGIRVNAISAGLIDTKSLLAFPSIEEMKNEIIKRTPAKRVGRPEDLAGLASFLCSSDSDWIVGQTIVADGGLSLI